MTPSSDVKYLYCITYIGEDFITTSFSQFNEDGPVGIDIFNFNQQIDITKIDYVAIDYTLDVFVSFNKYKYTNSNALTFYQVRFIEQDVDRMTVRLEILGIDNRFDIRAYKREKKIENIIE